MEVEVQLVNRPLVTYKLPEDDNFPELIKKWVGQFKVEADPVIISCVCNSCLKLSDFSRYFVQLEVAEPSVNEIREMRDQLYIGQLMFVVLAIENCPYLADEVATDFLLAISLE